MWRNLKSPSLCVQFMVFCCILHCFVAKFVFFLAIFAVLSHDRFLRFTRYYVEKNLAKNSARGEKMTNMRYAWKVLNSMNTACEFKKVMKLLIMGRKKRQQIFLSLRMRMGVQRNCDALSFCNLDKCIWRLGQIHFEI